MFEDEAERDLSLSTIMVDHMLDAGRSLFAIERRISRMRTLTDEGRAELWQRAIAARPGAVHDRVETVATSRRLV